MDTQIKLNRDLKRDSNPRHQNVNELSPTTCPLHHGASVIDNKLGPKMICNMVILRSENFRFLFIFSTFSQLFRKKSFNQQLYEKWQGGYIHGMW